MCSNCNNCGNCGANSRSGCGCNNGCGCNCNNGWVGLLNIFSCCAARRRSSGCDAQSYYAAQYGLNNASDYSCGGYGCCSAFNVCGNNCSNSRGGRGNNCNNCNNCGCNNCNCCGCGGFWFF